MKIISGLALGVMGLALMAAAVPAFAANTCYTAEQMEAEQLLRLHSELMVITVTCRQGSQGEALPAAYGDFTHRNIRMLHDAEQTMIAYFRDNQSGDPVEHLDRLRTILANEFGQKSATMTAPEFCTAYRDKVLAYDAATSADVLNEVERMKLAERSYAPPCAGSHTVMAKKGG